jgi:hypothetical protein
MQSISQDAKKKVIYLLCTIIPIVIEPVLCILQHGSELVCFGWLDELLQLG